MRYAEMIVNQEQPEIMPNVFAHHLAALTGHHHFTAHRALLATNPAVLLTETGPVLCVDDLLAVLAALDVELLRGLA